MAKILIGIVAVIACISLVDSLMCNKCSISLFGYCLSSSTETCGTNTSVCYTSKASFPTVTSFNGFNQQGCTESSSCPNNSVTTNGTIGAGFFSLAYTVQSECCSTDKCNPVNLSGASANVMSLSMALSAAALAAVWGSYM